MDDSDALTTATKTVADENAGWSKIRWAARYLFEFGRFDLAERGFERLIALRRADAEALTTLHQLYTDRGDLDRAARLIAEYLDERRAEFSPGDHLTWSAMLFDTLASDPAGPDRSEAVLDMLEAAAATGVDGWTLVLNPHRRGAVEAALQDPAIALAVLEPFL